MVSRRQGAQMLSGMRLGDMAAALDGRRLRRQEDRANDEREARRLAALNQGLSQVIGGIGDVQDRKAASKAQEAKSAAAAADAAAKAERFEREFALKKRREDRADSAAEQQRISDVIKREEPGRVAQAGKAFDPAEVGDDVLGMPLGEDESPEEAVRADLVAALTQKWGPETGEVLAEQYLAAARDAKTDAERAQAKADMDAVMGPKRARVLDLQGDKLERQKNAGPKQPSRAAQLRERKLELEVANLEKGSERVTLDGPAGDLGGLERITNSSDRKYVSELAGKRQAMEGILQKIEALPPGTSLGMTAAGKLAVFDATGIQLDDPKVIQALSEIDSELSAISSQQKNALFGASQTDNELKDAFRSLADIRKQSREAALNRVRATLNVLNRSGSNFLRMSGVDPSAAGFSGGGGAKPDPKALSPEQKQQARQWVQRLEQEEGRKATDEEVAEILSAVTTGATGGQ